MNNDSKTRKVIESFELSKLVFSADKEERDSGICFICKSNRYKTILGVCIICMSDRYVPIIDHPHTEVLLKLRAKNNADLRVCYNVSVDQRKKTIFENIQHSVSQNSNQKHT